MSSSSNATPRRILIVDDEELIVLAMRKFFLARGFLVDTAQQLDEIRALLTSDPYDLVISDLRLTGAHGTEGLQIVADVHQRSAHTRVIVLTAFGTPEIEQESYDRGAHAFLHKPKAMSEIADVADALLEGR
jgi:DNA-binding NtrC family response regulator